MLGSAHDQVPLPVDVVETLKDTNVSFFSASLVHREYCMSKA